MKVGSWVKKPQFSALFIIGVIGTIMWSVFTKTDIFAEQGDLQKWCFDVGVNLFCIFVGVKSANLKDIAVKVGKIMKEDCSTWDKLRKILQMISVETSAAGILFENLNEEQGFYFGNLMNGEKKDGDKKKVQESSGSPKSL